MKKKRTPRPVRLDTMTYVLSGFLPVAKVKGGTELRTRCFLAFDNILHGRGVWEDVDDLVSAVNICEQLAHMGYGEEYLPEIEKAMDIVFLLAQRKKYLFKGGEIEPIRTILELHDELMQAVSTADMEKCLNHIAECMKHKREKVIPKEKQ